MKHFFSENRNVVIVIIVNEIRMGVKGLVGVVAVDLWAVTSGISPGNHRLLWQGVDLVWGWGVAAAR